MFSKVMLTLTIALTFVAPARAADDPVAKAEALLKAWRDKGGAPQCIDLRAVAPDKGVRLDRAGPGEPPHFITATRDRKWNGLCKLFFEPMSIEGFFAAPPFCKKTGEATALCTLMTATSQPRTIFFALAPDRPEGVTIDAIGWQRKPATVAPADDDDDLPM